MPIIHSDAVAANPPFTVVYGGYDISHRVLSEAKCETAVNASACRSAVNSNSLALPPQCSGSHFEMAYTTIAVHHVCAFVLVGLFV